MVRWATKKKHVVAIVRLAPGVATVSPTYIHVLGWILTVPTVDDGVGENTYTLCIYLIGRR